MAQQPVLIQNLVPGNRYSIVDRQGIVPATLGTFIQVVQTPGSQAPSAQFNNLSTVTNPANFAAFGDNDWFFFEV